MTPPESICPSCGITLKPNAPDGLCPRCLLDSAIPQDADDLKDQPGVPKIDGIELQAEIGEGGFGIVYRAYQVGVVRRTVALKVLKPGVDTRQVLRRFEIERQALAHLEHPGIARFYEAGQTREGYRSVRELMADLRRLLNGDELAIQMTQQKSRSFPILIGIAILAICLTAAWFIQAQSSDEPQTAEESEVAQSDYQGFEFEFMDFEVMVDAEAPIAPFLGRRNFCWIRFQKPDGGEFILSHDCLHGSPTVTRFFVGGKRPDAPGVRIIEFDSPEDKALAKLLIGLRETAIGPELANQLENTAWSDRPEGKGSQQLRLLKNLLGSIWFFQNQREE